MKWSEAIGLMAKNIKKKKVIMTSILTQWILDSEIQRDKLKEMQI